MPILPTWSQAKTTSKAGFDKVYNIVDKLGDPVNKLSHKVGAEAFWPTTLDRESDKAARILRSFCKDGFYVKDSEDSLPAGGAPRGKARVVKKIPPEVIRNAKGLAIFTTMRTGLWVSGAGGSGILVARTATGKWSPPSGIMLHTPGLGFLVGVDIYDCVVVINTEKALEAFTKIRCTLGGEVSAVAGPVGVGAVLETEVHKRQAPIWTYLKSRGFYAGVQVDGTVIIERSDENEKFYGERIAARDILAGKVRHAPYATKTLMATLSAAQGDTGVDESSLPTPEPTPGDLEVRRTDQLNGFGLPAEDDPDPFGVLALEKEGFEIREAGTHSRPAAQQFDYKPSPSSPIFNTFNRHSIDGAFKRNSRRSSLRSNSSIDRGTQTDPLENMSNDEYIQRHSPTLSISEKFALRTNGVDTGNDALAKADFEINELESSQEASQPVVIRARLVTIPKRIPPALPPRNPNRNQASIITSNESQSPIEKSPGLGVGFSNSSQETAIGEEDHSTPVSPRKVDIDRKLDSIFLSPREEKSDPLDDPDHLLPPKGGFDEISLSGSDYSREVPAATLRDHQNDVNTPPHETPAPTDENSKGDFSATSAWKERDDMSVKADVFHSIPSTPVDAPVQALAEFRSDALRGSSHE